MTHAPGSIRRRPLRVALLAALLCLAAPLPAADLDVRIIDDRVSIRAMAVPLARLLATFDAVAGTESSVAPELRNRNVSVQFSELSLDNAVEKIFEGLGLDFVVVGGRRIMVTAVSGVTGENAVGIAAAPAAARRAAADAAINPFQLPGLQGQAAPQNGAQERVIQTLFGPMTVPEQETSPFVDGPTGAPGFPAPQASDGRTNLFGNTSPRMLDLNKQQPGTQSPAPGSTMPTSPTSNPFPTPR